MCIRDSVDPGHGPPRGAILRARADGIGSADVPGAHAVGTCLLYTSDAADERSSVDLGGRRIIKKKKNRRTREGTYSKHQTTSQHHTLELYTYI